MRVSERLAASSVSGSAAGVRRAGGARFSLDGEPVRASSMQAAAPANALTGLLAVQAAGDSLERKRRAMRRGRNILDTLDALKLALLSGSVSARQLETLKAQIQQRGEQVDEPELADVLAHIALRAEVELAKLGR